MSIGEGETVPEPAGDVHAGFKVDADLETGEPFHCQICLDLVYKPIVHTCGHIFCFWCAHRAMNPMGQSLCPICRRSHMYFPRICEMLHFFLMKAVPEEYSRRAQETQIMENTKRIFSPRLPHSSISPCCKQNDQNGWDRTTPSAWHVIGREMLQIPSDVTGSEGGGITKQEDACASSSPGRSDHILARQSQGVNSNFERAYYDHRDDQSNTERLTEEDFACASCRRLLYRPVVLNCGQAFCEACLKTSDSDQICPSCSDPNPGETVHVCLELHQYLERTFPAYSSCERPAAVLSRNNSSSQDATANHDSSGAPILARDDEEEYSDPRDPHFVHVGAGCDGCGMFPIVGDRYACTECCERIGYDLCGRCMKKGNYMVGRFSQAHRPSHRFRRVAAEWRASLGRLDFQLGGEIIQRRRSQQQQRLMFFELHF